MKRYFLITMLLALCSLYGFADVSGETPATGNAYYIYNVGQQKYLAISGTGVTLSSTTGTQFTVAAGSVSNTYTLTSSAGKLSTNTDGTIVNADGYYDNWTFKSISSDDKTYALGVLEDEDNYSYTYIMYSSSTESITRNSAVPEITDGQWIFTTSIETEDITYSLGLVTPLEDMEYSATTATVYYTIHPSSGNDISRSKVVTFDANDTEDVITRNGEFTDEKYNVVVTWSVKLGSKPETSVTFSPFSTTYIKPTNLDETVDVCLYHSPMKSGVKSPFCVPFDMTYEQLQKAFGENFTLYYYRTCTDNTIYYASESYVEAGVPYILIPDATATESEEEISEREANSEMNGKNVRLYKIEGVKSSTFASEPKSITHGNWTLSSTFTSTSITDADGKLCIFDTLGRLHRANSGNLYAYQAYLYYTGSSESESKSLPNVVFDDEWATVIDDIATTKDTLTIYNMNGQIIRENTHSTEGLPKGVYIINGKKTLVK